MFKRALSQLDRAVSRSGSGTKLVGHGSGPQPVDTPPDTPTTPAPDARTSDAIIDAMPPQYFEPDFEPLEHELAALPSNVNETMLEALVDGRTHQLEVTADTPYSHATVFTTPLSGRHGASCQSRACQL